jgi:hypothetical protein
LRLVAFDRDDDRSPAADLPSVSNADLDAFDRQRRGRAGGLIGHCRRDSSQPQKRAEKTDSKAFEV